MSELHIYNVSRVDFCMRALDQTLSATPAVLEMNSQIAKRLPLPSGNVCLLDLRYATPTPCALFQPKDITIAS